MWSILPLTPDKEIELINCNVKALFPADWQYELAEGNATNDKKLTKEIIVFIISR